MATVHQRALILLQGDLNPSDPFLQIKVATVDLPTCCGAPPSGRSRSVQRLLTVRARLRPCTSAPVHVCAAPSITEENRGLDFTLYLLIYKRTRASAREPSAGPGAPLLVPGRLVQQRSPWRGPGTGMGGGGGFIYNWGPLRGWTSALTEVLPQVSPQARACQPERPAGATRGGSRGAPSRAPHPPSGPTGA